MFDLNRDRNRVTSYVWEAFHALQAAGHRPRICSPHHLKVGRYNFYPRRGTIIGDEEMARPERGLAAFIDLLAPALPRSTPASENAIGHSPAPIEAAATALSLSLPEQT